MAERWEHVPFTIPAASTATLNVVFSEPKGEVEQIKIRIPYGHAGLATMNILYGGLVVLPKTPGALIKGNLSLLQFDVENYPTGKGWQFAGSNADTTYPHTFHVFFGVVPLSDEPLDLPPMVLFPIAQG